jgi:hypothetical protein
MLLVLILFLAATALPAGAELVSASSRIHIGTKLLNSDGSSFGMVMNIDDNHVFPDGKTGRGVLVDFGGDAAPQWVDRESVISSKFVENSESVQRNNDFDSGGSTSTSSSGCGCCCAPAFTGLLGIIGLLFAVLKFVFIKA